MYRLLKPGGYALVNVAAMEVLRGDHSVLSREVRRYSRADLRSRLTLLLVRPDYPVAELGCGEGGTTYVLLDDGKLIAIHRDADVAGIEELSRS